MDQNRIIEYARILQDLHANWMPHEGQVSVGKALFFEGKQFVFLRAGRKTGKSEFSIYSLYRTGMTQPNSSCYYIAPFAKQARELIWANNRIQTFLGDRSSLYIESINNSECRVKFKNGSFIKLDGADNFEAYRGINPHFIVYDEFKDHHPKFHEAMEPNLATHKAPLLVIGTPPDTEFNHFFALEESIEEDSDGAVFKMSSYSNPHIDASWLDKMKDRLIRRGDFDVWQREYMAEFMKGGKNHIFPMLKESHLVEYDDVIVEIKQFWKDYDFVVAADPGTASCFAVLFMAVHRYNRKVFALDELYITSTMESSVRKVWSKLQAKLDEIHPFIEQWTLIYDEAATWFQNELADITDHEVYFTPTSKKLHKKEMGISLIKDLLTYNMMVMTDRCEHLYSEMSNYMKDENGNIPKKNDHLIDSLRYSLNALSYTHLEQERIEKTLDEREQFMERKKPMEEDRLDIIRNKDWLQTEEYYD